MASGNDFAEWLGKRKSETTVKAYTYWLRRYAKEHDVGIMKKNDLITFYENHPNLVVRGFIKNLCTYLKITPPPLDSSLIKKKRQVPHYYESNLAKTIMQEFNKRTDYGTILWLMLECGLRISEATNLRYEHIKFAEARIVIKGKGNKERTAYPSPELISALQERQITRPSLQGWVFENPARKAPIKPDSVRFHLRKILQGAKPHTFRHTYATNLLKAKVPLRTIQKALGHESPTTTSIYTHVFDEDLEAANKKVWLNNKN